MHSQNFLKLLELYTKLNCSLITKELKNLLHFKKNIINISLFLFLFHFMQSANDFFKEI